MAAGVRGSRRRRRSRRLRRTALVAVVLGALVVGLVVVLSGGGHGVAAPRNPRVVRPAAVVTYTNPVFDTDFPDPEVLWAGTEYVAVATGTPSEDIQSAVSSDLTHWRRGPDLLPHLPAWAVQDSRDVWGPHLERVRRGWVLWFSAQVAATGRECIGTAVSATVLGPYSSSAASPALCQESLGGSIDPSVAVDRSGARFLLWKSNGNCCGLESQIWSQRLAGDGVTFIGEPTALLGYAGGWQQGPTAAESTVEGPSMLVSGGDDFLWYSGGGYLTAGYAMGVAECRSFTGPCTPQSVAPSLAATPTVAGPGGGSVFVDRHSRPWLAYAAWTPPLVGYAAGGSRSFRIDRLVVVGDQAFVLGPTTSPQPLIGRVSR